MLRFDSSDSLVHPEIRSEIPKRVDVATQAAFRDWLKLRTDRPSHLRCSRAHGYQSHRRTWPAIYCGSRPDSAETCSVDCPELPHHDIATAIRWRRFRSGTGTPEKSEY